MTILPATLTAVLFFLVVPAVGIMISRSRWRAFRNSMQRAALKPRAGRSTIHYAHSASGHVGEYRFFGTLEALQADDRIWVRDGETSVEVDMTGTSVVLLPEQSPPSAVEEGHNTRFESLLYSMASPERVSWKQMTSLTEGTRVFVYGRLVSENGVPLFVGFDRAGPLVVLYDGSSAELLSRAIWYGRHRNEYWNFLTPLSLIAGMLVLVILAGGEFSSSGNYGAGILTLGLASIPLLPLFPPGVLGYFVYRRLWLKGRARRAWRDLLRLPLLYWESRDSRVYDSQAHDHEHQVAVLPDGERYATVPVSWEQAKEYLDRGALLRRGPGFRGPGGRGPGFLGPGVRGQRGQVSSRQAIQGWTVFGTPSDHTLVRPSDPMAELVVLPSQPAHRSKKSAVLAYMWEIAALIVLGLSMFVNFTLFVRILPLVI